jgi:hypothetical protein
MIRPLLALARENMCDEFDRASRVWAMSESRYGAALCSGRGARCPVVAQLDVARTALLLGAALTLALAVAAPVAAQNNWCIQSMGESGTIRCGFATFEQCNAERSYSRGVCITSPYAGSASTPTPTRPRARRNR